MKNNLLNISLAICLIIISTISSKLVMADDNQENLRTCLKGTVQILCKYNLLSLSETTKVKEAERQYNLRTCLKGTVQILCKYNLLSLSETTKVKEAERQYNLRSCMSGNYKILCKYHLLSPNELIKVKEAENVADKYNKNNPSNIIRVNRLTGPCYESTIVKPRPFMGNNEEIFKLRDGTIWEVKYEYEYLYEYSPDVIICPSKGKLVIDGESLDVEYMGG